MNSHVGATSYGTESAALSSTQNNWILLNKHESITTRIPGNRSPPIPFCSPASRDAPKRISSINRLNYQTRRRLQQQNAISDTPPSISEEPTTATITLEDDPERLPLTSLSHGVSEASRIRANCVIDDSFRFISDESSLINVNTSDAKKDLIQHPLTTLHQMPSPPRSSSSVTVAAMKRAQTGPLQLRPSLGHSDATDNFSTSSSSESSLGPSTSKGLPISTTITDSITKLNQTGLIHTIPIKMIVNRQRAESMDSDGKQDDGRGGGNLGSKHNPHPTPMTISKRHTPSRWSSVGMHFHESGTSRTPKALPLTPGQIHQRREHNVNETRLPQPDYLTLPISERQRPRSIRRIQRKTPSLLRRDSYFYGKCDICFNQIGLSRPACSNRFNGFGLSSMTGQHNHLLQSRQHPRRQFSQRLDEDNRGLRPMNGKIVRKTSRILSNLQHRFTADSLPVTIEPYFNEVDENVNDRVLASELVDEMKPSRIAATSASKKVQEHWSRTVPPRAPPTGNVSGWGGFGRNSAYVLNTSPPRHIFDRALNVEALQRHPSYLGFKSSYHIPLSYHHLSSSTPTPASHQSTVIWPTTAGPAWKSIEKRSRTSPVFRYGKPLPKWLYDYDAYAEEQRYKEIERRRQKVIAIILIFLFFALIVAAGVVLTAVH